MKKTIFILMLLLFAKSELMAFCCCQPESCNPVKKSVGSSVERTIEVFKQNDKNIYAAKLHELNRLLQEIQNNEKNCTALEHNIVILKQTEMLLNQQIKHILHNHVLLQTIKTKAILLKSKAKTNENTLLLTKEKEKQ